MIGAIIQARMGSTRLPGKSMMLIEDKPILQHVVERTAAAIPNVYIVTTKTSPEIICWACLRNIPIVLDRFHRDVLDSYYHCADVFGIDPVVRITADNPLINPRVIRQVADVYWDGHYDYVSNNLKRTYPKGWDVEVFSFKALKKAWEESVTPYEHEHVTPYIYNNPDIFRLFNVENDKDESHLNYSIDTAEDLERVRREVCGKEKK